MKLGGPNHNSILQRSVGQSNVTARKPIWPRVGVGERTEVVQLPSQHATLTATLLNLWYGSTVWTTITHPWGSKHVHGYSVGINGSGFINSLSAKGTEASAGGQQLQDGQSWSMGSSNVLVLQCFF